MTVVQIRVFILLKRFLENNEVRQVSQLMIKVKTAGSGFECHVKK